MNGIRISRSNLFDHLPEILDETELALKQSDLTAGMTIMFP